MRLISSARWARARSYSASASASSSTACAAYTIARFVSTSQRCSSGASGRASWSERSAEKSIPSRYAAVPVLKCAFHGSTTFVVRIPRNTLYAAHHCSAAYSWAPSAKRLLSVATLTPCTNSTIAGTTDNHTSQRLRLMRGGVGALRGRAAVLKLRGFLVLIATSPVEQRRGPTPTPPTAAGGPPRGPTATRRRASR